MLPDGWDLERLRARSGCTVELLSCDLSVALTGHGDASRALRATCILSFSGLCLVRTVEDPDWYLGLLAADGSISCWASYGPDLGEAIDGL